MLDIRSTVLLAALAIAPLTASAAELPLTPHRWAFHHARVRYEPRIHFGYYWYRWGWRCGGTRHSWRGSSFAFAEPWYAPWYGKSWYVGALRY